MDFDDLEAQARAALGAAAFDYVAGGAGTEITVAENEAAWDAVRLRPRVLRDVAEVDLRTSVLGREVDLPVLVAPMGYQRLAADAGEAAMARAAAAAGALLVLSTMATVPLEDVAAAAPNAPRWFQLYVMRDRRVSADLVRRAEAAGYEAIVLTVDVPVFGLRPREGRHRFQLPDGMPVANLDASRRAPLGPRTTAEMAEEFDPSLTFDDLEWLASLTRLPIIVKGVLRGDDARAAVDAGAAGVIVSNHGGRQLDTVVATARALPEVAAAVADRAEVYVDGGIRQGSDVIKALALGARAVLVGRPLFYALAAGGEPAVTALLTDLAGHLANALAQCGARTLADLSEDLLA